MSRIAAQGPSQAHLFQAQSNPPEFPTELSRLLAHKALLKQVVEVVDATLYRAQQTNDESDPVTEQFNCAARTPVVGGFLGIGRIFYGLGKAGFYGAGALAMIATFRDRRTKVEYGWAAWDGLKHFARGFAESFAVLTLLVAINNWNESKRNGRRASEVMAVGQSFLNQYRMNNFLSQEDDKQLVKLNQRIESDDRQAGEALRLAQQLSQTMPAFSKMFATFQKDANTGKLVELLLKPKQPSARGIDDANERLMDGCRSYRLDKRATLSSALQSWQKHAHQLLEEYGMQMDQLTDAQVEQKIDALKESVAAAVSSHRAACALAPSAPPEPDAQVEPDAQAAPGFIRHELSLERPAHVVSNVWQANVDSFTDAVEFLGGTVRPLRETTEVLIPTDQKTNLQIALTNPASAYQLNEAFFQLLERKGILVKSVVVG
ncbi:MAG: hypothetical protein ACOYKZ_01160 [Chlamydiia bacterium]